MQLCLSPRRAGGIAALALSLAVGSAMAAPAISSFTAGTTFTHFTSGVSTIGWKFTVAAGPGITVNALGWWDQTPTNPLSSSHQVGIWNMSGTLLASTTVGTTDALTGSFRYSPITALMLSGGTSYLIGGFDNQGDGDPYTSGVSSLVMNPLITHDGPARNTSTAFSAPTTVTAGAGRFGPNFDFTAITVNPAPEPASLAITLTALGLLGASRLRRRSKAA